MLARMFGFFKPRWKKEADLLYKGAKKFIHYKRDLLKEDRVAEIESRRSDLLTAMKRGDKDAAAEAGKQLRATCEQALPRAPQQTWWEENVEVMFVALVVALGLRAYVLQPFRIPTGSMQPTLNGIVIRNHAADEEFKKPWFGQRAFEWVMRGRTYKDLVAESDVQVTDVRDSSWFLFTRTKVSLSNGKTISIPAAAGETQKLVLEQQNGRTMGKRFEKGDSILRGWIDTGDLVLVDKISYHFRKPERGEVFVFDTRAIATDGTKGGHMAGQEGGTHYIKRLVGTPGDALSIEPPDLLNHGKILQEKFIQRVIQAQGGYGDDGRHGYELAAGAAMNGHPRAPLQRPGDVLKLRDDAPPGLNQFAAMGDNTANSLDSRYWGAVHEFNLVGPALFSLWPFTTGHWGFIR